MEEQIIRDEEGYVSKIVLTVAQSQRFVDLLMPAIIKRAKEKKLEELKNKEVS